MVSDIGPWHALISVHPDTHCYQLPELWVMSYIGYFEEARDTERSLGELETMVTANARYASEAYLWLYVGSEHLILP